MTRTHNLLRELFKATMITNTVVAILGSKLTILNIFRGMLWLTTQQLQLLEVILLLDRDN
jgi:hypothetical protein